tara:strand:- start:245 stop:703 length:459 start_codon:yes stop_codon:yes gene_type:complete
MDNTNQHFRISPQDASKDELRLLSQFNVSVVSPMSGYPKSVSWDDGLRSLAIGTNGNTVLSVEVNGVDVHKSGQEVIDKHVSIETKNIGVVVKGHANTVKQIAAHPSLPIFASVGDDRALNIWHSEVSCEPQPTQHTTQNTQHTTHNTTQYN